jgi:RNA recognition motif-containing protein
MVRTKVFVGNLAFSTKEPELAAEFEAAGKVISANIITRGPRSLGYGFVEMESEEGAENAVKLLDKKEFQGRQINVEVARPREETKPEAPKAPRGEGNTGPTERSERSERRPVPKKKNYIKKEDKPASTKAEETQPKTTFDGPKRKPKPRNPAPREGQTAPREAPPRRVPNENKNRVESQTTLFVANLPFSLDDTGFAKIVTDLSLKLKSAHVVTKRNTRSKGYGFVEFDNHEDQQKALGVLNKKVVDGRELSVKVALTEPHTDKKDEDEKKEATTTTSPPKESKPVPKESKPATKETTSPKDATPKDKPATKETKPVAKESKPAVTKETAKPVAKESKAPVAKDTAAPEKKESPKAETKPVAKETKPAAKESKPAAKETKPAAKEAKASPKKEEEKK